jgi:predicted lipoprotein with Yx(FWY)xxD motif
MRTLPSALIAVGAVAAIAGCGGSSKPEGASAVATGASAATAQTATAPTRARARARTHATASAPVATAGTVKISSASVDALGPVLVNAQGRTLYTFLPDGARKVTCVSSCALVWPPVKLGAGEQPAAASGVKQSLLASAPDPEGGRVVTYAGWPLYTYVTDSAPGTASGQALNLNGGLWYVIAPSGTVLHQRP